MVAKQLSIFLENKSGRLTEVTECLRKKVSIFPLSVLPRMLISVFFVALYLNRISI